MAHRRTPEADTDLDHIWRYVASRSGSMEMADRLVDSITKRFVAVSRHPLSGRSREDLGPEVRSVAFRSYVILYRIDLDDVMILRVIHGNRDISGALGS